MGLSVIQRAWHFEYVLGRLACLSSEREISEKLFTQSLKSNSTNIIFISTGKKLRAWIDFQQVFLYFYFFNGIQRKTKCYEIHICVLCFSSITQVIFYLKVLIWIIQVLSNTHVAISFFQVTSLKSLMNEVKKNTF